MCPSILCPSCSKMTYHKGSCENSECSYDPLNAHPTFTKEFLRLLTTANAYRLICVVDAPLPCVQVSHQEKPFRLVRLSSHDDELIEKLRESCGYESPPFATNVLEDLFYSTTEYGFDFVKKDATSYQEAIHAYMESNTRDD